MMNLWMSIRRTVVPLLVGSTMASMLGPFLDETVVTEFFVAVLASVYYIVFRVLEQQGHSWATVFLAAGVAPTPHYDFDVGVGAEVDVEDWVSSDGSEGSTADSQ